MTWKDATLNALRRFSNRNSTRRINRQQLIDEELDQIVKDSKAVGVTPSQTLSRVLQELRNEGLLYFLGDGSYLLADTLISVEIEDLPIEAIDYAIKSNKLAIGILPANDEQVVARRRIGQDRIRILTLENYGYQCAFCDVNEPGMLIAGHISRWADDAEGRGNLSNTLCLCKFHDVLFENGYFSLSEDYKILKKGGIMSRTISLILDLTENFRHPAAYPPTNEFLSKHRVRTGF